MSFFIPSAMAQAGGAGAEPNVMLQILMFGGLFAVMYFVIIRPQRKRQKEHQSLMEGLSKGDEVLTSGGIIGKIVKVDGDYMVLEVGEKTELKFQKVAIHAVLPKGTIKAI